MAGQPGVLDRPAASAPITCLARN